MYSCSDSSESSSLVTGTSSASEGSSSNNNSSENESQNESDEESEEEAAPTLIRLDAFSNKVTLFLGDTADITVIGYFSDGSASVLNSGLNISSSNASVLNASSLTVSAESAGSANVDIERDGQSRRLSFVVYNANLTGIEFDTPSINLPSNGNAIVKVIGSYDNGQSIDITDKASLSSNDSSIATISSNGEVNAISTGSSSLAASYGGFNTSININVSSLTISSIQVTPVVGSKAVGEVQQFYATATLSDNSTMDISSVCDWSSSNSSALSISSTGLANLNSTATVIVEASYQGINNKVNFTVNDKTLSSIRIESDTLSTNIGITSYFTAIGVYSDSSEEDITSSVTFSTDDSSIAIISNVAGEKGKISALAEGTTNISAELGEVSASVNLEVADRTLSSIRVETNNSLLSAGINAYFSAIGVYSDATEIEITENVTWSISNPSYGTISNSGSHKGLYYNSFAEGTTESLTINADYNGVNGNLDILLAPGTISSITINPSSAIKNMNQIQSYQAYANFSDGASVEITDIVTWSSSDENIAIISNSKNDAGLASFINEGSLTIQASYNGNSSNISNVTVDDGQTEEISEDGDGLLASYFSGNNFNTLAGQRVDSQINFNWDRGLAPLGVGDSFSVRWQGQIKGKYTGDCTIASRSDDGFRVYINGSLLIDVWFPHAPRWDYNYAVPFVEGEKQDIVVEFFENGGQAVAELYWECPGDPGLEAIPMQYLFSN